MSYRYTGDYIRARGGLPILGALAGGLIKKGISFLGKKILKKPAAVIKAVGGALAKPIVATALGSAGAGAVVGRTAAVAQMERAEERAVEAALNGGRLPPQFRRRINPLNPKALRRATRRLEQFRGHATKALRELGFTVQRSGRGRARGKAVCD
jgi:hypothetical protein